MYVEHIYLHRCFCESSQFQPKVVKAEEAPYRCEWYSISCETFSAIEVRNSGLSGIISPELHRLQKLRILILSENNLIGPILPQPSEIGKY
jgi:hypothetical protein